MLGSITIGENSKIGAGAVVLSDVPDNSTVVGMKAKVVVRDGVKIKKDLNHTDLPDPIADRFKELGEEIERLKKEVDDLQKERVSLKK